MGGRLEAAPQSLTSDIYGFERMLSLDRVSLCTDVQQFINGKSCSQYTRRDFSLNTNFFNFEYETLVYAFRLIDPS